jgi:hypothetical protein
LIEASADLGVRDTQGCTPLHYVSLKGHLECLQTLIEHKADLESAAGNSSTSVAVAAAAGNPKCVSLLINAKADVNARNIYGYTPAAGACDADRLTCLQLLVNAKADLNVKKETGLDAVYGAMRTPQDEPTHRVLGMPFVVLSCNTDIKNVRIAEEVTAAVVNTHIIEYKQVHNFIDECHSVAEHALSEDVVVDTRVGRGDYGLYHEPLEQVLLYLGLSMNKNQTVNTSIDGKSSKRRALMPGHPTNANLWFKLYQQQQKKLKK